MSDPRGSNDGEIIPPSIDLVGDLTAPPPKTDQFPPPTTPLGQGTMPSVAELEQQIAAAKREIEELREWFKQRQDAWYEEHKNDPDPDPGQDPYGPPQEDEPEDPNDPATLEHKDKSQRLDELYRQVEHLERQRSYLTQPASGEFSYAGEGGDVITVRPGSNGSTITSCTNGTTTTFRRDGSSTSINEVIPGLAVIVEIDDHAKKTITFPDGKSRWIGDDGSYSWTYPDGSTIVVHTDGSVQVTREDGSIVTGLTLEGAIATGWINDVEIVSTGENVGDVIVLEFNGNADGLVVFEPAIVVPDDNAFQRLSTFMWIAAIAAGRAQQLMVPGMCREEPQKPPAYSGSTEIRLDPLRIADPSVAIREIVRAAIARQVIPATLAGDVRGTTAVLDQVVSWLLHGATVEEVSRFIYPRLPPSMNDDERVERIEEICGWGERLVSKTVNLGKQLMAEPMEIPA